jgi:hypothetical protein
MRLSAVDHRRISQSFLQKAWFIMLPVLKSCDSRHEPVKKSDKDKQDICPGYDDRPAQPRTQHDYHHDAKVKPEAATAVFELLMMGGKTRETC